MKNLSVATAIMLISVPVLAQTGFGSGVGTSPSGGSGAFGSQTFNSGTFSAGGGPVTPASPSSAPTGAGFEAGNQPAIQRSQTLDTSIGNPSQQRMEDTTNPGGGLGGAGTIDTGTAPGSGTRFDRPLDTTNIGTGSGYGTGVGSGATSP